MLALLLAPRAAGSAEDGPMSDGSALVVQDVTVSFDGRACWTRSAAAGRARWWPCSGRRVGKRTLLR